MPHIPFLEDLFGDTGRLLQFRTLAHFETLTLSPEMVTILKNEAVRKTLKSLVCQSMIYPPAMLRDVMTGFGLGDGGLGMAVFGGGDGNGVGFEIGGAATPAPPPPLPQSDGTGDESALDRHKTLVSNFWTSLKDIPNLRSLELHCASLEATELEIFLAVLKRLERFDLHHTREEHFVLFSRTWANDQAAATSVTLAEEGIDMITIAFDTVQRTLPGAILDPVAEVDLTQDNKTGYWTCPRLKSLALRSNTCEVPIQFEMVKHFPNLTDFSWLSDRNTKLRFLENLFYTPTSQSQGYTRKINRYLQHLDVSDSDLGDVTLSAILNNLPHLRHLSVAQTKFGEQSAKSLIEREKERWSTDNALVRTAALEVLDLRHCHEVSSRTIQAMLETFTEMRDFKASHLSVRDMVDLVSGMDDPDGGQNTFHSRSWVCLQIEFLELTIRDMAVALALPSPVPPHPDADNDDKVRPAQSPRGDPVNAYPASSSAARDRARKVVYNQLSKLTRLKRLCLGEYLYTRHAEVSATASGRHIHQVVCQDPVIDLTLDHELATLETLVLLEELHVGSAKPQMQLEDVQWIVQAWPKLRRIRGRLCPANREDVVLGYLRSHHPNVRIALDTPFH
ncbi:hypothetical protein BGZ83_008390 [Gryganskiella cystojenkinii]|nr:hypothetical protein BGZ83_008390 [Gryganskiella cystojenkinii]